MTNNADPAGPPRDPITPQDPVYLTQGYPSSVKGGTVIAGDVWDREEHEQRLVDPATYRPRCPVCGRPMQGHGLRERRPLRLDIRRYRCRPCKAVVQVLPAFVARHLWRLWATVEAIVVPNGRQPRVAERTMRRWRERAMLLAQVVLHVLSSLRTPVLDELVAGLGLEATRRALLLAFRPLAGVLGACAALTVLLGRVVPGLRVM